MSIAALAAAAAMAVAGLVPATPPAASPSCGWKAEAVALYRSLPAADRAADRVRAQLAASGVTRPGFLDGCSPTDGPGDRGPTDVPTCATAGRPYFPAADWLWEPIPAGAELDPESAAMTAALADGDHVLNTGEFGVTLVDADEITPGTPRAPVPLSEDWGPDPLAGLDVPVPADVQIPSGSDAHVAIADPRSGKVVNLWGAHRSGTGLAALWGAATDLDGDGREHEGSSTGAGIARYAAVVRASEIAAGDIPHALFFSTNIVEPGEVRYPATKTDGSNMDGSGSPIPEGARVQLDPSVDVTSLPGITPGQAAIATALQRYGAYVGDNGGARAAFIAEYAPDSDAYERAGLSGDYVALDAIPWDRLRVLSDWSGGTRATPGDESGSADSDSDPGPGSGSGSGDSRSADSRSGNSRSDDPGTGTGSGTANGSGTRTGTGTGTGGAGTANDEAGGTEPGALVPAAHAPGATPGTSEPGCSDATAASTTRTPPRSPDELPYLVDAGETSERAAHRTQER